MNGEEEITIHRSKSVSHRSENRFIIFEKNKKSKKILKKEDENKLIDSTYFKQIKSKYDSERSKLQSRVSSNNSRNRSLSQKTFSKQEKCSLGDIEVFESTQKTQKLGYTKSMKNYFKYQTKVSIMKNATR